MKLFLIILALIYAGFIICVFIEAHEEEKEGENGKEDSEVDRR